MATRGFYEWSEQMATPQRSPTAGSNNPFRRKPVGGRDFDLRFQRQASSSAQIPALTTFHTGSQQPAHLSPSSSVGTPTPPSSALALHASLKAWYDGFEDSSHTSAESHEIPLRHKNGPIRRSTNPFLNSDTVDNTHPHAIQHNDRLRIPTFHGGQRMGYIPGNGQAMPVVPDGYIEPDDYAWERAKPQQRHSVSTAVPMQTPEVDPPAYQQYASHETMSSYSPAYSPYANLYPEYNQQPSSPSTSHVQYPHQMSPIEPRSSQSYSYQQQAPRAIPQPVVNLQGVRELNILVLGETGVGKSTFINAFANYLAYESLDYALYQKDLVCVIPSSFTWQSAQGDEWISKHINVKPNAGNHNNAASLKHEKDGTKGQSATQETKTYDLHVGNTTVHLLDTPGIGDTRGSSQDKKNMNDILAKIRSVGELHGILILLKPNNARLGLMFNFCIKELLTHLHRDAAKNIVFGFTNARNTSFRPGETYATLKSMLDAPANRSIGIKLNRNTTYCFDSESFRCLAAHQGNVDIHDMGDIRDYALSWEKSAAESYRMLEHFLPTNTTPHRVEDTWNLYRTRELVRVLTIPMADITQTINQNIALQEEQQRELTDALVKGEALESALHLDKIEYEMRALDRPRTVCSHKDCVEYFDEKKHYKSHCHDPCSLQNVQVDKIQCEELMQCHAFGCGRSNDCTKCGHSWQVHLHVLWEPVEVSNRVIDDAVQQRLHENASGVEVMEEALRSRQNRINQYKQEREVIQKAAGQFAVFLTETAMCAWNDSKLEYLDHLIEEEKGKIQAGGSKKRFKDLEDDRRQHIEEVKTLQDYAKAGAGHKLLDQEGIKDLITKLFQMELTGANLQKVATQLEDIQMGTQKESGVVKRVSSLGFLAANSTHKLGSDLAHKRNLLVKASPASLMESRPPSFQDMLRPKSKDNGGLRGFFKTLGSIRE